MNDRVPGRAITTVVGLVVPLAITAASAAVALSWRDDLPDPVASHWSPDGVDGFSSLDAVVGWFVVGSLALIALGWGIAFFLGNAAVTRRLGIGTSVGLATFLGALLLGTLDVQRGLADAAATPDIDPQISLAMVVGVAAGVLASLVVRPDPHQPATEPLPAGAPTVELADDVRAAWVQHVHSTSLFWIGGTVAVGLAVLGVLTGIAGILVPIGVVVGLLVATLSSFTVTVDARGLTARGPLGWPRLAVPLDEVVEARVVAVRPLAEFGGWGYRVGRGGKVGLVMRAGESIEVTRTGGRAAVVTVDDAQTGAALLNTLASRSRVV